MNILITVTATKGSAPREAGTWMVVRSSDTVATLGGGNVEHQAIAIAREMIELGSDPNSNRRRERHFALGPSLGQCCGGTMDLSFAPITDEELIALQTKQDKDLQPIALFGGGHVGQAIVNALTPLPYRIQWIDSRDEIFPIGLPAKVQTEHSNPVHMAADDLVQGSHVLIMSFSHAEDLDIVQSCLQRIRSKDDLLFVGLIGSKTKWATFKNRLRERGFSEDELARITCPIGLSSISGKEPEVIAASVAAQLLTLRK